MAAFRHKRDWTKSTISRAHDTRELTKLGGSHGNAGSLTFSISLITGTQFLTRFCNGHNEARVKLELHGNDILILPAKPEEVGRKFSLSTYGHDYRSFFDGSNYPWINAIKPFGATVTPTRVTDRGIAMVMPLEKDRNPIEPYTQYKPRNRPHPYPPRVNLPAVQEVLPPNNGTLYLVMVPPETDEQFHTLLRFLKLEALKE